MSRILPRHLRHEERERDLANIARILLETEPAQNAVTVTRVTLAGDSRRLRGFPIVAHGVPGMSTESRRLLNEIESRPLRSVV